MQLHATNARRWGEALRLGQILEGALVMGVRWDAWAMVLEQCLLAAKATGDRTAETWALHQIGSRAVCVGASRGARSTLSEALKLRESLNELDAAAASRHNLSFVLAPAFELGPEPAQAVDERFEFDALPLQDGIGPGVRTVTRRRHSALPAVACAHGDSRWWSRLLGRCAVIPPFNAPINIDQRCFDRACGPRLE